MFSELCCQLSRRPSFSHFLSPRQALAVRPCRRVPTRSLFLLIACVFIGFGAQAQVKAVKLITTYAGNGDAYPYHAVGTGNGGPATGVELYDPFGVAVDSAGNVYIADSVNNLVWKVVAATGNITIIAGNGATGFSGDGGPATGAELDQPESVAVDSAGDVYIADAGNNRVREVVAATGVIETVAGTAKAVL